MIYDLRYTLSGLENYWLDEMARQRDSSVQYSVYATQCAVFLMSQAHFNIFTLIFNSFVKFA
jgi:hypothetical protein